MSAHLESRNVLNASSINNLTEGVCVALPWTHSPPGADSADITFSFMGAIALTSWALLGLEARPQGRPRDVPSALQTPTCCASATSNLLTKLGFYLTRPSSTFQYSKAPALRMRLSSGTFPEPSWQIKKKPSKPHLVLVALIVSTCLDAPMQNLIHTISRFHDKWNDTEAPSLDVSEIGTTNNHSILLDR